MAHLNRIIAITGAKRSGKDAIAEYLQKTHDYDNIKIAGVLKDMVKLVFNMTNDQVDGDHKELLDPRWGITPRQAMQFMGTEVMQFKIQELLPDIGRNFWMKQLCAQIRNAPPATRFAISDVRFIHEVEALRREFGPELSVVKVIRPSLDLADSHASEKEWMLVAPDTTIVNDGSLQDLYSKINANQRHDGVAS